MPVAEKILLTLALAHVAAGTLLSILPLAPGLHGSLVAAIFGAGATSAETMFLVSVFAPTVASWGILFFALARSFFRNPAAGTWRALVLAVVVWASLDSALCFQYGMYFAVALNAVIAAVFLGALLSVRNLAMDGHAAPKRATHPS